jgi:hypothetical protein
MMINPKVVSDRFEDEIVVVNLDNGFYYSLKDSAMEIWAMLERRATRVSIEQAYQNASADQLQEINSYLNFLIAENLAAEVETGQRDPEKPVLFTKPQYAKFEDMANLIMIDPIHEADDTKGWPNKG